MADFLSYKETPTKGKTQQPQIQTTSVNKEKVSESRIAKEQNYNGINFRTANQRLEYRKSKFETPGTVETFGFSNSIEDDKKIKKEKWKMRN